ncbi:MAG: hypothetical protein V3S33_05940 [Gammaproteobacteria bacterium]
MYKQTYLRSFQALLFTLLGLTLNPVQAQILISEIYYDAVGHDSGLVFVELIGPPGTPLDGFSLLGINGDGGNTYLTVPLSGSIPSDQIFVIGDENGDGDTLVPNADLVTDVNFQNGPDSIALWDGSAIIDAVGYGDFSNAVFAGEGLPAIDPPRGYSLARRFPYGDTNNNAVDFLPLETPTPGEMSSVAVPLPGAFGLLVSGLLLGGRQALSNGRKKWFSSHRCSNKLSLATLPG